MASGQLVHVAGHSRQAWALKSDPVNKWVRPGLFNIFIFGVEYRLGHRGFKKLENEVMFLAKIPQVYKVRNFA